MTHAFGVTTMVGEKRGSLEPRLGSTVSPSLETQNKELQYHRQYCAQKQKDSFKLKREGGKYRRALTNFIIQKVRCIFGVGGASSGLALSSKDRATAHTLLCPAPALATLLPPALPSTHTVYVLSHVQDDVVLPSQVAPVFADHLCQETKVGDTRAPGRGKTWRSRGQRAAHRWEPTACTRRHMEYPTLCRPRGGRASPEWSPMEFWKELLPQIPLGAAG